MKTARPGPVKKLARRVAPTHTARVIVLCSAFAIMIGSGIVFGLRPGRGPTLVSLPALAASNPADGFLETRLGTMLFWPDNGDTCRRVTIDNRADVLLPAGYVPCIPPDQPSDAPKALDRLAELQKAFRK